jgi:hypothetical protein
MKNLILIIMMFFGFVALNPILSQDTKATKYVVAKPINEKMAEPAREDLGEKKEIQLTTEAKITRQAEARKMQKDMMVKSQLKKESSKPYVESMNNTVEIKKANMKKPQPTGKVYEKNSADGSVKYKKSDLKPNVPALENKENIESPKTLGNTK